MKYVILCDAQNVEPFIIPRQLSVINGEKLVERTIRQLKENGVEDIVITSHDKRFDDLGATRYEPLSNNYNGKEIDQHKKGYWLDAFPQELLTEPITFLLGDVYFSDEAIKKIVDSKTNSTLFFCSDKNKGYGYQYIKKHDEPFAYKVIDCELFKEHIDKLKDMWDKELTNRHPIIWELYRSINGLDVNKHILTTNYIPINDITCDIDNVEDIELIENKLKGGNAMYTLKVIRMYDDNILGRRVKLNEVLENVPEERAKYLLGDNEKKLKVVEVIKVYKPIVKEAASTTNSTNKFNKTKRKK